MNVCPVTKGDHVPHPVFDKPLMVAQNDGPDLTKVGPVKNFGLTSICVNCHAFYVRPSPEFVRTARSS